MDPSDHISQDALEQYAMETLPESEIEPLEVHLRVCEACQDRLGHLDQFITAFCAAARKIAQDAPGEEG
jgi:anti-sigma factor RsiW